MTYKMKRLLLQTLLMFLLLSCQAEFEEESTVILTKGVFNPVSIKVNGKNAGVLFNHGDYEKGSEAVPFIFSINNSSDYPLKNIQLSFLDPEVSEFNYTVNNESERVFPGRNGTCLRQLGPKQTCTIEIDFYSDQSRKIRQRIAISYDNLVYPNTVTTPFYVNSGIPANLIYSSGKSIFTFGQLVGPNEIPVVERALAEKQVKYLTLVNTGELTAKNLNFSEEPNCLSSKTNDCPGGHENAYEYEEMCPESLGPGESCSLNVYFQPLNKDPDVGEIAEEIAEINYSTKVKTHYITGPLNNSSILQGSFSSLSTRIEARFRANTSNMIFPEKITVGNRLNQAFKISNSGYRSGLMKQINIYKNDTLFAICQKDGAQELLECNDPDLSTPIAPDDFAFYIMDKDHCLSKGADNVYLDVGDSCLFQVIFQPSINLEESENIHDVDLKVVFDSRFQGEETILERDLITIYGESKSKAKIQILGASLASFTQDYSADNLSDIGYIINLGRLPMMSPNYYTRRDFQIRFRNIGATKAKDIVIKDFDGIEIPSITQPPFSVNLGNNTGEDESFYSNVSKSDNCNNLPPGGICTLSISFAPIAFSADDNVIDANMYDVYFSDGAKFKGFKLSYDSQAKFSNGSIFLEDSDVERKNYVTLIDATLIRKGWISPIVNSNKSLLEWKGQNFLSLKKDSMVAGNEFEYTFVYRNIGTGPIAYLGSYEGSAVFPQMEGNGYEVIPTADPTEHGADYDCIDIVDFSLTFDDDVADIQARAADWDPLPKEKACALTLKMKTRKNDYTTLLRNSEKDTVMYTGLNWLSRGFPELEDGTFHISDDNFNVPLALVYYDGDNTAPSVSGLPLQEEFGVRATVWADENVPLTEPLHDLPLFKLMRERKAQIRPLSATPTMSSVMWQRAVTYDEADAYPGYYDDNVIEGNFYEWTSYNYMPPPFSLEGVYWMGSLINDHHREDNGDIYLCNGNRAYPMASAASARATRLVHCQGYIFANRGLMSPDHVDNVIEDMKDDYPFIIHLGTFETGVESYFTIRFGNTAFSQEMKMPYTYWLENTESGDGVFKNNDPSHPLVSGEKASRTNEVGILDKAYVLSSYVGEFTPPAEGVYTQEFTLKYTDGITVDGKEGSELRVLSYPVLVVAEGISNPPKLKIEIQEYSVTKQEGTSPLIEESGAPYEMKTRTEIKENGVEYGATFEFVKNDTITTETPFLRRRVRISNSSTLYPLESLNLIRKDEERLFFASTINLFNYGIRRFDTSDCDQFMSNDGNALPLGVAGSPTDHCDIIIDYQPSLADPELDQFITMFYKVKDNQFQYQSFPLRFRPIEPALVKTELAKNSFRNEAGNLVPNASTLDLGKIYMSSGVINKTINDIRLFNETETHASLLVEYHNYLKEYNLKGFSNASPPPLSFIPPATDYEVKGGQSVVLFKRIKYENGDDKFLIYGSESCFIGDDEYPESENHYLEGFDKDSSDCYLSVSINLNKDFIAKKINFSDGTTLEGNYFSINYFNNERLSTSMIPLYFVIDGTFYSDNTLSDGDIYDVVTSYHNKNIKFKFNPMVPDHSNMGEITGYRIFYSTSKSSVTNTMFTQLVPSYVDIRDSLDDPEVEITNLTQSTFYYLKIYPIRYYANRTEEFPNASFEGLGTGEFLSLTDLGAHRIVVPSESTVFHYPTQMLIHKSYLSANRYSFSDAIVQCSLAGETFYKNGIYSLLSFSLINDNVVDVINDNPSYTQYSSGTFQSQPHWIDTAPISPEPVLGGLPGYDSEELSQAFVDDKVFYLKDEGNMNGALQKTVGGGPSPISSGYTNYITPSVPFGVARCFIDASL